MKYITILFLLLITGCTRNVQYVKSHADARLSELGYTISGYEGYQWSLFCGGDVWYQMKRADSPGVIYSGFLCKWGSELHIYNDHVMSGDLQQIKN